MPSTPETLRQIEELVKSERVVLFMKGSRSFPQCGFSAQVVQILNTMLPSYKTVNVLADAEVRQGIKDYSSWPTIPQLYVEGEFVGGCDIVNEMFQQGELHTKLGVERKEVAPPTIHVSDAAAEALRDAMADAAPNDQLHLGLSPRFEHDLFIGPPKAGELAVAAQGLSFHIDPLAAEHLEGVRIDFVTTETGKAFRINNPNAPAPAGGDL